MSMLQLNRYRQVLKDKLTPERYQHSLCVRNRAARLAACHQVDWYRAALAGLLHDICHCEPKEAQLKYLKAHGILLDNVLETNPPLWHAMCGSIYLREALQIRDRQVLAAVRYHTTGRAGMSPVEQVVCLADATSSDREYPGARELGELADRSLDEAMFAYLRHTVAEQVGKGQPVVRDAWEAYNYYSTAKDDIL